MKRSTLLSGIMALLFLLAMIFDSRTALSGAADGVQLCVTTVIPSLFPFFVISILLTGLLSSCMNGKHTLLLMGFLGGYPVGAQCVAQAFQSGRISRQEAERKLCFCNNAGPAFLFGIGSSLLPEVWMCWLLWLIHILSALLVAALTPKSQSSASATVSPSPVSLTVAMQRAVRSMGLICGWIILFRTVIAFCRRWFLWLLPGNCQLLVMGLLEMTNGCCTLNEIASVGLRLELLGLFLGFGGLCVLLQTKSVLAGSGLSGCHYFPGKVAQAAFSFFLCVPAQLLLPAQMRYYPWAGFLLLAVAVCIGYGIYWAKIKNRSSIPVGLGV